ncbi:aldehyde dehydrogenase family protein [Martelella mediterranea]|uniref:Sulfoacetaldehyde dehydrogenase n=1 Tax=Martelella mediterranea DSM 17316 TaxID=1122214 RepID=A0A1U9Z485_9HYPH|nr:aldehyde dehydrogenase family protein [Martelella mediterranea]AQZ52523.1 Sulfoacetaldehyde dehydrogenase [Martelella mediterranea DSM 17316]
MHASQKIEPRQDAILSPYDGSLVGHMPVCEEADIEQAILTAQKGFDMMRKLPRFVRADILERTADLIEARKDEFVRLIAAEAGKPLYDARGEISRSLLNLRGAAREARAFGGEEVPLDIDGAVFEYQTASADGSPLDLSKADLATLNGLGRRIGIARRFPIGPILAITPFNFPLNLVLHKLAPAFAVGNSVILKPAPQTPLTSRLLAEVLYEAGLPEEALTVVHCDVPLAEKLVRDDRIAMVTFTGSVPVGWHIKSLSGKKKVSLELGGNGAVVVSDDADIAFAAARCVRGGVVYGGQYCIGVQRIFVHEKVYDAFEKELVARVEACKVGNPMEEGVDVGPVIDERSAMRIESWINEAVEQGARVLTGGTRDKAVIAPTVLTDTKPDMKVEADEIFGPVVTLTKVKDADEGVRRAADSRFGLQGGFFTNDMKAAFRALEDWDVGALMINDVPIYRIDTMPFGGWKDSGLGREGTRYAMDSMTDIKLLVVNYG